VANQVASIPYTRTTTCSRCHREGHNLLSAGSPIRGSRARIGCSSTSRRSERKRRMTRPLPTLGIPITRRRQDLSTEAIPYTRNILENGILRPQVHLTTTVLPHLDLPFLLAWSRPSVNGLALNISLVILATRRRNCSAAGP
jgi:hypothetical protein